LFILFEKGISGNALLLSSYKSCQGYLVTEAGMEQRWLVRLNVAE
jgi:hypothetical protein